MADTTGIEWADATWNPVTGCTEVSPGCDHCYAKTFAERFRGTPGHYFEHGFDVQLRPGKLGLPVRWRRPRRIFVNSMSDLFHDQVPDDYIAQVLAIMASERRHTFQLLTKRHARMRALLSSDDFQEAVFAHRGVARHQANGHLEQYRVWPLPNVWLGVSTENQQWADIRIPALLDTPAAVRWISAEPLIGPINLAHRWRTGTWPTLDWVVVGGESGRGARPMHPRWAESLQQQCETAGIPFLFKQWGEWTPMAPINKTGQFDFSGGVTMTDDGTIYQPEDLYWPDGPRRGEALRANFPHHRPTSMYRVGKHRAGRELYHDGRTFDQYPEAVRE